jgi:DNA-directed RNA polymerase specialized sigma24 family protein
MTPTREDEFWSGVLDRVARVLAVPAREVLPASQEDFWAAVERRVTRVLAVRYGDAAPLAEGDPPSSSRPAELTRSVPHRLRPRTVEPSRADTAAVEGTAALLPVPSGRKANADALRHYEECARMYRHAMIRHLVQIGANEFDAEDAVQEVLVRMLFSHLGSSSTGGTRAPVGEWLVMARRMYLTSVRRRSPRSERLVGLWPDDRVADTRPGPEDVVDRLVARDVLCSLQLRERTLLVVWALYGPHEGARIAGLSSETMRSRLKRARQILRSSMAPTD